MTNDTNHNTLPGRQYGGIDIAKFVMAIFVVAIHTKPLAAVGNPAIQNIYALILDLAVPYFFTASGFLLASRMDCPYGGALTSQTIGRYLRKVVKLYLGWTVIYFPLAVFGFAVRKIPWREAVRIYIRRFILVGEQDYSWPLWYLLSAVYALVIVLIIVRKRRSAAPLIAMIVVFSVLSFGLPASDQFPGSTPEMFRILQHFIQITFGTGRIFCGAVFIPLGMLLARRMPGRGVSFVMFAAGMTGAYLAGGGAVRGYLLLLSTAGLFCSIAQCRMEYRDSYRVLRGMSTGIYFLHMYVFFITSLIRHPHELLADGTVAYGAISFIVTVAITAAASLMIVLSRQMRREDKRAA